MTLAVRTPNWIGDCVMALPALRLLESHLAPEDILLVTRPHLADLFTPPLVSPLHAHPLVRLPATGGWREVFSGSRRLRRSTAKSGLLLTNSFGSALMFRMAGIRRLTGFCRDGRDFMLTRRVAWTGDESRQVDAYMDLAAAHLGIPADPAPEPEWLVPDSFKDRVRRKLLDLCDRESAAWIGISPCAAYGQAKEWPHERYYELIQTVSAAHPLASILLFGAANDHERLASLAAAAPGRTLNLARSLSLAESIAAASLCRVFVTNDSGMMHVAAAVGTPVVAIFGPTDPRRYAPRSSAIRMLRQHTPCSPCKRRQCREHTCMRAISVSEVREALETVARWSAADPR
ncbi:MAG: lipopolysaccharide heptosyltransferase II [Acidobacteriota bacterium]|jgi:heptosyltransferase-2|nr:lipopolysaccharide heptosyltransferase II [Acidobacteriota bacterium]